MPKIFVYKHAVRDEEMDPLGHANNVAYVEWMQQAAVAHSDAQGWPGRRYRDLGLGWVVRSHKIEYLKPALAGDRILVRTWVATLKKVTSLRRFRIIRETDGELLAKAETLWAFVDYSTGQPRRICNEVAEAFQVVPDDGAAA
jgi:acyl-CoA thioester hydrolase